MNRKGIFFSLTAILLLIFLIIIFTNQAEFKREEERVLLDRAKIISINNFVKDFDQFYVQQILETSSRHALVEKSASVPPKFMKADLVATMKNGMSIEKTTDGNFEQALGTLAFTIPSSDREFVYSIEDISHPTFNTIKIDFKVSYTFKVFDRNWTKRNKPVMVEFPVFGLSHPDYSLIVDDTWVEDICNPGCLLSELMDDFDPGTCTVNNIIPSYLVVLPCP